MVPRGSGTPHPAHHLCGWPLLRAAGSVVSPPALRPGARAPLSQKTSGEVQKSAHISGAELAMWPRPAAQKARSRSLHPVAVLPAHLGLARTWPRRRGPPASGPSAPTLVQQRLVLEAVLCVLWPTSPGLPESRRHAGLALRTPVRPFHARQCLWAVTPWLPGITPSTCTLGPG